MNKPLSDLTILDLSRVLAGPWATQFFADLGATVIKIEQPQKGDDTRHWGPPYLSTNSEQLDEQLSAYFLSANRGKHSLAIDISQPEGQSIVRALAKKADILVENFKVGGLAKYQLDYESLKSVNPRLVYCSITGFGQTGPASSQPGYDAIIQAQGGLMSVTGADADLPDSEPQKVGVAVCDLMTGMYAVGAILAAIHQRDQSGEGSYIDLALLDTQVAWLANQGMNYLVSGNAPQRQGNAHPNIVPYQTFMAADGHITVAVGNDQQFQRFCSVIGRLDWASDERFSTNAQRLKHREVLVTAIAEILLQQPSLHWIVQLQQQKIPCAVVNTIDQVFEDDQVKSREMKQTWQHPVYGEVSQITSPIQINGRKALAALAPPLRGEHSAEVLKQYLEYSEAELEQLEAKGVIEVSQSDALTP
ncbi:CaiB/BaiF CoA-transferase family protein [Pleionea sp. CnH1-48]|uniref:CaiB/BaiF CoA transferase family protein n=1 Tax=Pleionea sp. CnH1-48 TaxID=2954494 RepID=UPI002098297C|nr:CaiB/BaiF CoA-transferase family protein [Pleionea sp. CnH1-48]MCO7224190.1 CoA transferase [Pleionea sp. CnH1-48]